MGMNPATMTPRRSNASAPPPTVFTLVLDDLLMRHYPGTNQGLALTATAGATGFVELDDDFAIYSATDIASDMQSKLEVLTGYSGLVTVNGSSSEAGDKYTFTITFDASLGEVTLDFDGTSQWYPTITLNEAVAQQGSGDYSGAKERVTLSCNTAENQSSGDLVTIGYSGGSWSVNFGADSNTISSVSAPSGFSEVAGGAGNTFVTVERNTAGDESPHSITGQTSNGSYSLTTDVEGAEPMSGNPEVHTITPSPVNPTGGTYVLAGSSINYDDENPTFTGNGWDTISKTSGTSLAGGAIGFTNGVNGDIADDSLSPVNIDLTAPEIPRSIL